MEEGSLIDLLSAQKYLGFTASAIFSVRAVVSFICSVKLLQTNGYMFFSVFISDQFNPCISC